MPEFKNAEINKQYTFETDRKVIVPKPTRYEGLISEVKSADVLEELVKAKLVTKIEKPAKIEKPIPDSQAK